VNINPQLPFGHYLPGLLYVDTGRAEEAIPQLEIARKSFAKEAQIYFALGNAYAKLGKKEEAARMRAEFVRLNAAKKEEPGATVYGEQSSDVLEQKMQEQNKQKPP
jgi:predicted Zn-dependent protease